MAQYNEDMTGKMFEQFIKQRISDYIQKEVAEMVKAKSAEIVQEVLSNLRLDSERYKDLLTFETNLIVKAIYNGQEVPQRKEEDAKKEGKKCK
jgi:hypothetical protein